MIGPSVVASFLFRPVHDALFCLRSHVDRTYQDGVLVAACQLGDQHASVEAAIEACGGAERVINTKACDATHRNLKCCNCANCAVKKAATAGPATASTLIPESHANVFYNLPIKAMWPFNNAACLENTIFILGDTDVKYPTYNPGQLQPLDDRVHKTVCRFLAEAGQTSFVCSEAWQYYI
jgi:hypothetical protein